jgi:hypothetical protein
MILFRAFVAPAFPGNKTDPDTAALFNTLANYGFGNDFPVEIENKIDKYLLK